MSNFDESKLRVWLSVCKGRAHWDGITFYYPNKNRYLIWNEHLDDENTLADLDTSHYDYELKGNYRLTQEDLEYLEVLYDEKIVERFINLQEQVMDELNTVTNKIIHEHNFLEE